jgi:glutamate synthase (NADPH/NADH) small chain
MPTQDPKKRINNFNEVNLGYSKEEAILEAKRCLDCKKPKCVEGCPVNINIPLFIKNIIEDNINKAYEVITNNNLFPSICGRVCPQELQCEKQCIRGIKGESVAIGNLERYVGDNAEYELYKEPSNNIKVAIVGSGPAGLSCASTLRQKGYDVTVFEALHKVGGVLRYGIPEFRLPKKIVDNETEKLKKLGVRFISNVVIGKTITIDQLFMQGFKAIYIGTGAGLPRFLNVPGENLNGVFSANEYLTRINLMEAYKEESTTPIVEAKTVCVVGGGNVAMDAARCARRMNADVYVIYRRSKNEMPARLEEIKHAEEEGIKFIFLANPIEIIGNEKVEKIKCIKMELKEADSSGRKTPVPIPNSEFAIDTDAVILALGNYPNPLLKNTDNLNFNKWGCIEVDENLATSIPGVFAGGDVVTGAATVIKAMEAGQIAAKSIINYLNQE